MTFRHSIVSLISVGIFLWPSIGSVAELPTVKELEILFADVALKTEFDVQVDSGSLNSKDNKSIPILRWTHPVHARLLGKEANRYKGHVEILFKQLSNLTRLPFLIVDDESPASLVISFMSTREVQEKTGIRSGNCVNRFTATNGIIWKANVYISTENDSLTQHCIVEEIVQAIGLPNDTSLFQYTIFNDSNSSTRLLIADQLLIATLYNPHLKPGMSAKVAMPIVQKIIKNILKGGNIKRNAQ